MATRTPFQWNTANFTWDANNPFPNQSVTPFTWDDVALVEEIAKIVGGGGGYHKLHNAFKDTKKKERFVKLLCKVKGIEYEESKEMKDYKIVISDVELVVNEVMSAVKIQL